MYKLNFLLKLTLVSLITLFTVSNVIGQIEFEKGYFIDNEGVQTECLVKNMAWDSNPTEFSYKLVLDGKVERNNIQNVKEFCVYNQIKYIRFEVDIDRSSMDPNRLSEYRVPQWSKEIVFLQVVLEGNATLYLFKDGRMIKYFYSVKDIHPKQLVYKKYFKEDKLTAAVNKRYQNQLWTDLKLDGSTMSSVTNVSYKVSSLSNYFKKYNGQFGNNSTVVYKNSIKGDGAKLNLKFQTGIAYSSLSISNSQSNQKIDFGSKTNVRLGVELEMLLPFNNGKWSFFVDPTFEKFTSEVNTFNYWEDPEKVKAEIHSFRISFGLRHYFYINEQSKIFINITMPYHLNSNSKIDFVGDRDLDVSSSTLSFVGVGLGYSYKGFSAEFRRDPNRVLLSEYMLWHEEVSDYSLTLSYRLLGGKSKDKK